LKSALIEAARSAWRAPPADKIGGCLPIGSYGVASTQAPAPAPAPAPALLSPALAPAPTPPDERGGVSTEGGSVPLGCSSGSRLRLAKGICNARLAAATSGRNEDVDEDVTRGHWVTGDVSALCARRSEMPLIFGTTSTRSGKYSTRRRRARYAKHVGTPRCIVNRQIFNTLRKARGCDTQ